MVTLAYRSTHYRPMYGTAQSGRSVFLKSLPRVDTHQVLLGYRRNKPTSAKVR
jgi:hypothetical protein